MKKNISIFFFGLLLLACNNKNKTALHGQMPNLTKDYSGTIHLVYGRGDSILYSYFNNNENSFSSSALVAVLPKLGITHKRSANRNNIKWVGRYSLHK